MRAIHLYFCLALLSFLLVGCSGEKQSSEKNPKEIIIDDSSDVDAKSDTLIPQKPPFDPEKYCAEVDSLIKNSKGKTTNYGWLDDRKMLIERDSYRMDADEVFIVFRNDTGTILMVTIAPQSQSGDWVEYEDYYFDPNGNTIHHSFHHSSFVTDCGSARISWKKWYNEEFEMTKEEKLQTDFEEKPVTDQDCFAYMKIETLKNLDGLSVHTGWKYVLKRMNDKQK